MFVRSLHIKNFRCFVELSLDDLNVPNGSPASGLNLLIGENGNGKTTVLEALNLLTQSSYTAGNVLDVGDFADIADDIVVEYTSHAQFRCKMPPTYHGAYYDADGLYFSAKLRTQKSPGRLLSSPIQASGVDALRRTLNGFSGLDAKGCPSCHEREGRIRRSFAVRLWSWCWLVGASGT